MARNEIVFKTSLILATASLRGSLYKYLGCHINKNWDVFCEVCCRSDQARSYSQKVRKVLTSYGLTSTLPTCVLQCYVFSILLYGVKAWTLANVLSRKLKAFKMWSYRRMLKIPWRARVTSVEVLWCVNKMTEITSTDKRRKLEYFGHIMWSSKYNLLQLIRQGKTGGSHLGCKRISRLKNLSQWFGLNTISLFSHTRFRCGQGDSCCPEINVIILMLLP